MPAIINICQSANNEGTENMVKKYTVETINNDDHRHSETF